MVERIVPGASLSPLATPVDRFVSPQQATPKTSWLQGAAEALATVNPALQSHIGVRHDEYAAEQEAEGQRAEASIDARYDFENNRRAWRDLISNERRKDRENGTSNADRLAGASPHFRRGLMKQRLNRVGMGLNDHLMNLWRENPMIEAGGRQVPLHEVDDTTAIQSWMMQQTQGYTAQFGLEEVDPLLYAEVLQPRINASQDGMIARHTEFRLNRYNQDYMQELDMGFGMVMAGGGTNASDIDSFLNRLAGRESSNNFGASNNERGSSGRNGHFGRIQFGHDRLDEARAAGVIPADMTAQEFLNSPSAQRAAERWHIQDIDNFIEQAGFLDKGWSLDGMRAVAHLGGKGGLRNFIMNGANPSDSYGTSLMDYYTRFSGPTAELQEMADSAIADGMDPQSVNRTVVDSIIRSAMQSGNVAVLDTVDNIDAGSGKLGQIGWVQDEVAKAREQIEAAEVARERAEAAMEEDARKQELLELETNFTREILANPYMDINELQQQALDLGDPGLATAAADLQEKLIDRVYDVETNHEIVADLRIGLSTGEVSTDEFVARVREGTGIDFPASVAMQMMDDFDRLSESSDLLRDSIVRETIADVESVVKDRFTILGEFGQPTLSGVEKGVEVTRRVMIPRITEYLLDNPEATKSDVRQFTDDLADRVLRSETWKMSEEQRAAGTQAPFGATAQRFDAFGGPLTHADQLKGLTLSGELPTIEEVQNSPVIAVTINQLAVKEGLSSRDFMVKYGIIEGN